MALAKTKKKTATADSELRVRMYRVGFGDFFLVTVPSGDGPQHILIDCGVTPGTTHKGDIGTIKDAVADMAKETKNKLALIIVTHRHMDHIIGFSRCKELFEEFKVESIWMPYWESEYDEQATKMQAELTALALDVQTHLALSARLRCRDRGHARHAAQCHRRRSGDLAAGHPKERERRRHERGVARAAEDGLRSEAGVLRERRQAEAPESTRRIRPDRRDSRTATADALTFMKLTDLKKGVGQYLGADAANADGPAEGGSTGKFDPFGEAWHATAADYPPSAFREWAPRKQGQLPDFSVRHNAALEAAIHSSQPSMLFTAVKALDSFLNNQSLVVLFTFAEKKLLFVGDAQAGNWEYWMYGGTPEKAPSIDALTTEGKTILSHLDFYKVGHHGSTNATPITAVDTMDGEFVSMCSTQADTFGTVAKGRRSRATR